jgi:hypothetical protein
VEVFGVLRDDEVVVFAVDEEGGDVGLLYVPANGVEGLDAELMLSEEPDTFSLMVDLRKLMAIPLKRESPPPCFSASYLDSFSRLEKGESNTRQPIS